MKKFISIVLVAVLLFSFAACNNASKDDSATTEPSTLELNIEELKYNWTDGVLTFEDGKQVTVPNTVNQFLESSGLVFGNYNMMAEAILKPDESETIYFSGTDMYLNIKCKNLTDEDVKLIDSTIIEYSFNNTQKGNKNIKFANTLTVGVGRADVEEALGVPEGATEKDTLYVYSGRNKKRDKVELRIAFNSYNIVNSVAFKIEE